GETRRKQVDDGFTVASALPSGAATPQTAPTTAPADDAREEIEEGIVGFVEKLDDGKGAHWKDIVAEAARIGVGEERVEEALNSLMDKGLVYEPVLGRIKRAD
ncbi:MAG TPA: hypothetical protein VI997_07980, partial [Candidatus Thermoplasmatota archaeon]|nr:hypothetical protein [Candidatus Thermoplasmatota archaeon]